MGEYGEKGKGNYSRKMEKRIGKGSICSSAILKQQGLHHKKLIADRANIHPRIQRSASQRIIPMFPCEFTGCLKLFLWRISGM